MANLSKGFLKPNEKALRMRQTIDRGPGEFCDHSVHGIDSSLAEEEQ